MIYLHSDYSQGAHPKVLEALNRTNLEHTDGYGADAHCRHAAELVREQTGLSDCGVHFMVGGTPCNLTVMAAALRPYECAISPRSGHAYFHETGGVEATGHRIVTVEGENGKLTPAGVDLALEEFQDEHTPVPRLVYVSQPTELGSVYSRAELTALSEKCREKGLLLYLDGARLGAALTSRANDLSLPELARLCDAFYIGGTKNGALFGEALVLRDPGLEDHFRWMIKRQGGLLAKGRLLGVQFEALLEGGEGALYYALAAHANALAETLRRGLTELGVEFLGASPTNQLFPILPVETAEKLKEEFFFYEWTPPRDGRVPIRLVTSWGTKTEEIEAFLRRTAALLK